MSRGGYNIIELLVNRGLSKPDAIYIDNEIPEDQIPYLINSLVSESTESEELLRGILYEYGIDLEEEYDNVEILDEKNPLRFSYGVNVSCTNVPGLEDYLFAQSIPYITRGENIFVNVQDDATLYMLDNMINKLKDDKMSDNLNESHGLVLGFSNEFERKRLLKDAGINLKEDFGDEVVPDVDTAPMDGAIATYPAAIDPNMDQEEYPQVDVVTDPVTKVEPTVNSEAMNNIMDFLNSIQEQLPDVKLSEFKPLIIKINDLGAQMKAMGNSYISERRKK